jgi:Bacterial regulatory proteins, tetR family
LAAGEGWAVPAELLDSGGPDAVTLRGVGARAGVSRGAPYRHFADKESLLTAVAAESWEPRARWSGPRSAVATSSFASVATVFGERNAQHSSAILLTHAHGAAGVESSGLLSTDKWHTAADELIDALLAMVEAADHLLPHDFLG